MGPESTSGREGNGPGANPLAPGRVRRDVVSSLEVRGDQAMPKPSVEAIYLHGPKGEAMARVEAADARAGLGLEGDRYFRPEGVDPDREITLIEAEAVEALVRDEEVPFEVAESRR